MRALTISPSAASTPMGIALGLAFCCLVTADAQAFPTVTPKAQRDHSGATKWGWTLVNHQSSGLFKVNLRRAVNTWRVRRHIKEAAQKGHVPSWAKLKDHVNVALDLYTRPLGGNMNGASSVHLRENLVGDSGWESLVLVVKQGSNTPRQATRTDSRTLRIDKQGIVATDGVGDTVELPLP